MDVEVAKPRGEFTYSPMELSSYDKERHISVRDAYELLKGQKDRSLPQKKLKDAISDGQIRVYGFKDVEYVDRIDIGRVYHQTSQGRQGLRIDRYFSHNYFSYNRTWNLFFPFFS